MDILLIITAILYVINIIFGFLTDNWFAIFGWASALIWVIGKLLES